MNNEFEIGEQPNNFKIYYNEKDKTYIIAQLIDISYNEREYYTFISNVFPSTCKQYGICEDCKFQSSCYKSNKFTDIQNCIKYNNHKDKIMETENKLSIKDILNNAKKEMNNKYKEMNNEIENNNQFFWHPCTEMPKICRDVLIYNKKDIQEQWKYYSDVDDNFMNLIDKDAYWIYVTDLLKLSNYANNEVYFEKKKTSNNKPIYVFKLTDENNTFNTNIIKQIYHFNNSSFFIIENNLSNVNKLDIGIKSIASIIVENNKVVKNFKNWNYDTIFNFLKNYKELSK